MNRAAAAVVAFGALVAGLWSRRVQSAAAPAAPSPSPAADTAPAWDSYGVQEIGEWIADALPDLPAVALPAQNPGQEARNVAAFLMMVRAAEGTAKDGGYGALFGWPAPGRSFDPMTASGHPAVFFDYTDKAGKTIRTSAAGAYQIVYTTWKSRRLAFLAWASFNGRSTDGFLPATQDAFAEYLLNVRGALDDVRAGRLAAALVKARAEWASLPGANVNQPERTESFVIAAYKNAGGVIA